MTLDPSGRAGLPPAGSGRSSSGTTLQRAAAASAALASTDRVPLVQAHSRQTEALSRQFQPMGMAQQQGMGAAAGRLSAAARAHSESRLRSSWPADENLRQSSSFSQSVLKRSLDQIDAALVSLAPSAQGSHWEGQEVGFGLATLSDTGNWRTGQGRPGGRQQPGMRGSLASL